MTALPAAWQTCGLGMCDDPPLTAYCDLTCKDTKVAKAGKIDAWKVPLHAVTCHCMALHVVTWVTKIDGWKVPYLRLAPLTTPPFPSLLLDSDRAASPLRTRALAWASPRLGASRCPSRIASSPEPMGSPRAGRPCPLTRASLPPSSPRTTQSPWPSTRRVARLVFSSRGCRSTPPL